jgi:hypothetical protein
MSELMKNKEICHLLREKLEKHATYVKELNGLHCYVSYPFSPLSDWMEMVGALFLMTGLSVLYLVYSYPSNA